MSDVDPVRTLTRIRSAESSRLRLPERIGRVWNASGDARGYERRRTEWEDGYVVEDFDDLSLYERLLCTNLDCRWQNMKPGTPIVYFLQGSIGGPVKIGTTDSGRVRERVKQIQTGNPSTLRVLRTIRGGRSLEASIHRLFADFRLSGEWFAPEEYILAVVGQRSEGDGPAAWAYREGYRAGLRAGRERTFRAGVQWTQREVRRQLLRALDSMPSDIERISMNLNGWKV